VVANHDSNNISAVLGHSWILAPRLILFACPSLLITDSRNLRGSHIISLLLISRAKVVVAMRLLPKAVALAFLLSHLEGRYNMTGLTSVIASILMTGFFVVRLQALPMAFGHQSGQNTTLTSKIGAMAFNRHAHKYDCKAMGGIRCADQFKGSDCGAKIKAADASFRYAKGTIVVSRACGMNIETSISPQHSIWFSEGGTWNVSRTINVTHGGISISGSGMNDSITNPGTQLQWTGDAGKDMISISGTAANRLDRVVLQDMILDGGGTARYTVRAEKIDTAEMDRIKIRQGATAGFYLVDSTGWKLYNSEFTQCPSYCLVSDWGTGGFAWIGGNVDVLVANTNPAILVQGAINAWHMQNVELDASETGAFAGFIQISAFDANSSFSGAPPGGMGAPAMVNVSDSSFFQHSTASAPLQGADIVITGTAANPSQKVVLERDAFFGLNISPAAVKVDFTDGPVLRDVVSNGHAVSTLIFTGNASHVREEFVLAGTDAARCTGSGCGNQADIQQKIAGQISLSSSLEVLSFLRVGANGVAVSAHQHKRISTGPIRPATRKEIFLTWPNTMSDTAYTATCNVEDPTTAAGAQGLVLERIRTKSSAQIGVVINNSASYSIAGTIDCSADHD
jgi:hypothetical protein